jgi:hypothetical protein
MKDIVVGALPSLLTVDVVSEAPQQRFQHEQVSGGVCQAV